MNQLVQVIEESGLDKTKAQVLLENFSNYFEIAADWEKKASALVVNDVSQKAEMKMAREGRLFLKEKRVAVEKTRKSLKENALREGQTIDAIAKILTNLIVPIESDLEAKEKFAEIQEAQRKEALRVARDEEMRPYSEFVVYGMDLGSLSEEDYQKVLAGAKLQLRAKAEEEARVEAERIAKAKAEAEERERIRVENEKLKAEAIEREKQLAEERAKAEAIEEAARKEREAAEQKLRAEQESARIEAQHAAQERARLEDEIRAKEEAEKKALAEAEAAKKQAENASDNERLLSLANKIKEIAFPEIERLKSESAKASIGAHVKDLLSVIYHYAK